MGAREAAEIAVRGTRIIPATPEGDPVSSKPMRYRDSDGDIWETAPGAHGDDLVDEGGDVRSYDYVLSQYGPITFVHDDEPAEEPEDTPAPRDGDLTRTLRAAMKRYGVPAVMAEAGRLAQQRL